MAVKYLTGDAKPHDYLKFDGSPTTLNDAIRRMHHAQVPHRGQGFTIYEKTDPNDVAGPVRTLVEVDSHLRFREARSRVGSVFIVRSVKDDFRYGLHKVDVGAPYVDLECTSPFIDRIWQDVRTVFSDAMDIGDYVRKQVAGLPGVWSYHALGQAIDIRRATLALMQELANYLVAHHDPLHEQEVIFNHRVWESSSGLWGAYNGVNPHTDHVHTQVFPERDLHVTPPVCFYRSAA